MAANDDPNLRIIPGIEINTDVPNGEVHILGYFNAIPSGALQDLFQRLRDARFERGRGMTEKMAAAGCRFRGSGYRHWRTARGWSAACGACDCRGRLRGDHRRGVRALHQAQRPAYVERMQLSPAEAVRAIRDSGGVPVLAHPYAFDQYGTILKSVDPADWCRCWSRRGCVASRRTTIATRPTPSTICSARRAISFAGDGRQ